MEGPRGVRKEEFDSLRQLTNEVFRENLVDEYPQLFNEDNLENCRVMLDGGRVVSHVGMTEQGASILGCQVQVACIGAVSTLKEYRRRGLATRLFEDACAKALSDGIDLMIVSGDRGLYRRAGCRRVGRDFEAVITPEDAFRFDAGDLTIELCAETDLQAMAALYRAEPVRFLRRREDYERAFACRVVMNRPSDFLKVKKGDSLRAYLILQRPREAVQTVGISEYAGERASVVAVLGEIVVRYMLGGLSIHGLGCDGLLRDLLEEKGIEIRPSSSSGIVRIINFPQFMERMRPYFEEILGYRKAEQLRFTEEDGAFCITCGDDRMMIPDRGTAAHLIFGTLELETFEWPPGEAAALLREVLPIPALWYGLNYI